MAGMSNYLSDRILNHLFRSTSYSPPATLYLALSTTEPADDGTNVTEPIGNNYARKSISRGDSFFDAPSGSPRQVSNSADIAFNPASGGAWGTITHAAIYDALSGGNMLWSGALLASKIINDGDQFKYPANQLIATAD